ncbi:hypothetical protein M501DRAFT_953856, partial [Patellaria atrata CBS 101060]
MYWYSTIPTVMRFPWYAIYKAPCKDPFSFNFIHDMDGADSLLAVAIVFLILTWVSTFLRCYVRHWMLRSFAIDDWIAAVTLILFTIFVGFTIEGSRNGLNDHLPPNAPYELGTVQLKWFLLATLVYILTITTLKVSIGYTLLRFAPNKKYRIIIWIVVAVTTVVGIFYFFFLLTECSPPSRFWTAHAEHPKCRDPRITGGAALVLSGVNALTDWIFGLLPIGIVWKLKMSKFQKTVVSGVLAMGIFASIATIVRIESIIVFATAVEDPQRGILLWSITEPGIGLTAISLAALRPLISRFSVRM